MKIESMHNAVQSIARDSSTTQYGRYWAPSAFTNVSDVDLLSRIVGKRLARKSYRGSLTPYFCEIAADNRFEPFAITRELVRRWLSEEMKVAEVLSSPATVKNFLRIHLGDRRHECFVALFLDAQHRLIEVEELFRGTLTQTSIYPREVVKAALSHNAAAMIVSHNHPSGTLEPSRADLSITEVLRNALNLVDVKLLDHIIVTQDKALSLAERGLL